MKCTPGGALELETRPHGGCQTHAQNPGLVDSLPRVGPETIQIVEDNLHLPDSRRLLPGVHRLP
eukprot:4739515-Lingulodinium_polyedra.AAC.1